MTVTIITQRSALICLSVLVLIPALAFPRLRIVQGILLTPIYISSVCFLCLAAFVISAIQSERSPVPLRALPTARIKRALRPLRFTTPAAWSAVLTRQTWEDTPPPFTPVHRSASYELNIRLDGFLSLIKRHFILPWYERISPSAAFPHAVEGLIRHVLADFSGRAEDVDWSNIVVSKILPLVTDHFQHYRSIEHLSSSSTGPSPNPALPLPLPRKSHPALSVQPHTSSGISPSIEAHFRQTLERVLRRCIPEKDQSEVVSTLVKELVLGAILLPVFDMMCDADFWNRQIDEKGGRYLHEQKQVDKFLSALSALPATSVSATASPMSASKSRQNNRSNLHSSSSISVASSSKHFDNFLRSISKLKTLGDARRLRADVERELRSAKLALAEQRNQEGAGKDGDKKLRRSEKYVHRLDKAKVEIDARIASLSGQGGKSPTNSMMLEAPKDSTVNLYSILSDPSSLAYWLEHMERRGRSRLVQYWLTVEGFKDPLEAAGLDSAIDSTGQLSSQPVNGNAQTFGEDVAFLYEMYFAAGQSGVSIATKHRQIIEEIAQSGISALSAAEVQKVKHAVFSSQKAVYEQMAEEDWPPFQKSELFIKAVTDLRRAGVPPTVTVPVMPDRILPSPPTYSSPLSRPPPLRSPTTPAESSKSLLHLLSPTAGPRKAPKRGTFSPVLPVTPTMSVSVTPPVFERAKTEIKLPGIEDTRKVSAGGFDDATLVEASGPSTPPPNVRRSSHLDFLIFGEGQSHEDQARDRLFGDEEDVEEADEDYVEVERMDAIQAALNEIIASDDLNASRILDKEGEHEPTYQPKSPSASLILFDKTPKTHETPRKLTSRSVEDLKSLKSNKPSSTPRLSLSPEKESKHLFDDEMIDEDEAAIDEDDQSVTAHDVIQLAAPGDLQLSVEIARLQDKIQGLVQQDHLLDTMIRQAELTGNQTELRILRRSQSSVRREQRTAIFQKAQFEHQEEENRLVPGRTRVSIPSAVIATEDGEGGKQVVRYTLEVSQVGEDGDVVLGWVVARRYNEFWELDRGLRDWAVGLPNNREVMEELKHKIAEIPGKRLVPNVSANFVESRRAGLERYIQSLLTSSLICDSQLLRSFLSRSPVPIKDSNNAMASSTASLASLAPHNIVKSLYKTMATSLDDALLGPSMLDMMYTTLSRQLNDFGGLVGLGGEDLAGLLPSALKGGPYTPQWLKNDPMAAAGVGSSANAQGPVHAMGGESGTNSFTAPICDLFIEIFDLKENNWLRRQAIVVILQQFLGSTIERKVRDTVRNGTSSDALERIIGTLEDTLFPEGQRRPPSMPRTESEKAETKIRASKKLSLLIPDVAAKMIGRGNARRAARRVFGALQDTRLNQHLMLSIIDEEGH
ncbi:hypothetical protein I316_07218 [Kwoniella heveanensis BCC8398]|uniref:PXA domain-containing protein n=1 Tax=Kwoniella heveanensis BCC8398 TaxID=1296120 RepID=A0A1B9GJE3_9TREE|nr:hypothetical protein I316_07218 [Kwoniella heveanensis BCC8398]